MMKRKIIVMWCLLLTTMSLQAQDWVGTWATAIERCGQTDMPKQVGLTNNCIRQIVHVSLGGSVLRLQLSNHFSEEPVEIKSVYIADAVDAEQINAKTVKYLKFNGKKNVTIAPHEMVFSDALKYDLRPLQRLAITISYGATAETASGHRGSRTTSYIMQGESKPNKEFLVAEQLDHWYNIAAIDVQAEDSNCWACLGNSITDGRGTTTNLQNRWTDICAEQLEGHVGILNLGIGGNCVLQGGLGEPAINRFERDVMSQRGLTGIVIYEGINDIGNSRNSEQTAEQLISAYQDFISKAHQRGLKVVGGTITQMGKTDYWSYFHEAVRQTVNEWIRHSGQFDAVIDFDQVLLDPAKPTQMRADYQYDWLHPNAEGYKAMGQEAAKVLQNVK